MTDNRSFVTRATRMSPSQRRAYEELSERYVVRNPPGLDVVSSVDWRGWFAKTMGAEAAAAAAIVLDVGFGMGGALIALARERPETAFVGVEVHKPGIGRVLSVLAREGIPNVRVIEGDVVRALSRTIPDRSVSAVHLFFPDPWPKKRHHKRRLVRPGFPELLRPVLADSGSVYMVTDWEDYAWQMRQVFDGSPLFRNRDAGFSPGIAWRPETAFERKAKLAGRPIRELVYDAVGIESST